MINFLLVFFINYYDTVDTVIAYTPYAIEDIRQIVNRSVGLCSTVGNFETRRSNGDIHTFGGQITDNTYDTYKRARPPSHE